VNSFSLATVLVAGSDRQKAVTSPGRRMESYFLGLSFGSERFGIPASAGDAV